MSNIEKTWYPIVGDPLTSQLIAECDQPFSVDVIYSPGDVERVSSLHDGLVNFVAVDVPATARVEVTK
jgi:hypothetical protein